MKTERQAAIRSFTETATINSLASRILVMVGLMSEISRTWDGRCFVYRKITSFASRYMGFSPDTPSRLYCRIQYPTGLLYSFISMPPTTLFPLCFGDIWALSSSSTSNVCSLNGRYPSLVYLLTIRIPPSTFLRFTHILMICMNDWVPVTSQFLFLHHFFHAVSMVSFMASLPVFA